jgi:hypothetical protein
MTMLTPEFIRKKVADSEIIYNRGEKLFETGAYCCLFRDVDAPSGENKMIQIDRHTGEVTMKFKLPGF